MLDDVLGAVPVKRPRELSSASAANRALLRPDAWVLLPGTETIAKGNLERFVRKAPTKWTCSCGSVFRAAQIESAALCNLPRAGSES